MIEVGFRVVRGPQWKWNLQDNGEGHVGTVVEIGKPGSSTSPDKTVVVYWDGGSRTNYRVGYQDAYDLRVFDNAPTGVRHQNIICNGCKDQGISGMLWKCTVCFDFDLCTTCYMNDTHDLTHEFRRIDTPSAAGVDIPPRSGSKRIVSRGIFAGARVSRGPDWDWQNQDGGENKTGRVMDIRGWDQESGRSVANVIWSSGSTNVYRLGHKGKVDLKCVQASSGGSYYVDHLPILGMPVTRSSSSTSTTERGIRNVFFNVGDKVQVNEDIGKLKEKQNQHGGWNPRMADYIGKVGTVHRVTDKGDIRVQYENNIRWTFNPMSVVKITDFKITDLVQVSSDINKVKELQKGHGEWVEMMKDILGKKGNIIKIYGDRDLRIKFGNCAWTMNPLCVSLTSSDRFESNNSMYANTRREDDTSGHDPMTSMLPQLLDDVHVSDTSTYSIERFIREVAQGRIENVRKMLPKMKDKLNHKNSGKTALQVAAHQGRNEIVILLMANGATLEVPDEEGDTALHYSSFGNQPLVMETLLTVNSALINLANRGKCTPLHVAVNKQFLDCVKTLLKYKCNTNIQDSYGDTATHDAIGKDNKEIIDCLINSPGVDFTLKNNRGFNLLHHCALKGNAYAIEKLLGKSRQLVDVKKDDGFSSLHLACLNGHYDVAKILVEQGQADLNLKNNRKQTSLILAVSQGYCSIIEMLVNSGADVSAGDEEGETALHIILTKHFEPGQSQEQISQTSQIQNPVTSQELKKHDNAPKIAEIWANLSTNWDQNEEILGGTTLACFFAFVGADVNKKNRHGVSPLDLIRNERIKEIIIYYSSQYRQSSIPVSLDDKKEDKSAKINQGNFFGNSTGECQLCAESTDNLITFEPCMHTIVCEECCSRMKKCIECHEIITKKYNKLGSEIGSTPSSSATSTTTKAPSNGSGSTSNNERLKFLEKKFEEIEESYCCSICMERRKNVAFLCGHSACSVCSQTLTNCHFCRQKITQKINLY